MWDATTGKEIAVLAKWQEGTRSVAFSPDGKRVAVGSGEHRVPVRRRHGPPACCPGPSRENGQLLAYSPDGKRIASATGSNAIHLWNGESGKEVAVLRGHTAFVNSRALQPGRVAAGFREQLPG